MFLLLSAGLKYESEAVAIAEVSKTCSAAGALRVPVVDSQEVPALAECKLDASPEIKGARRQQIVGGTPVSVPASRVSSARKGKELQGQAGRVLRANADGVAGGNSSPRSLRASHRRVPLGWFPRGQKTESYLERKIRMLQVCCKRCNNLYERHAEKHYEMWIVHALRLTNLCGFAAN